MCSRPGEQRSAGLDVPGRDAGVARATIECGKAFAMTDFRQDLATIKVPTLVIHGDSDETVPFANSGERTAKMVHGAQLLVYAGAPHGCR